MVKAPKTVECPICGNDTTFASWGGVSNCNYCCQRFIALYDVKRKKYIAKPKYDFTQEEVDDIVNNRKWKLKDGKAV
jgi:hypothetical protein